MPSPAEALRRYKKLFLKLGDPEGQIKLRTITVATSVHAPHSVADLTLYKPIVDDPVDRQEFLLTPDRKIFHVWGGALVSNGGFVATRDILNKALQPGGGVLYYDILLPLIDYQRGFAMGGTIMEVFLIVEGIKSVK